MSDHNRCKCITSTFKFYQGIANFCIPEEDGKLTNVLRQSDYRTLKDKRLIFKYE